MEKIKGAIEVYEHIRSILKDDNFYLSDYLPINYGLQFTVSKLNWSGVIRIYQNKKGRVKIDYSQLNGGQNAIRIRSLIDGEEASRYSAKFSKTGIDWEFPIIGTDESGKGDYFGPLVSAGVYVDQRSAAALIRNGIKDSKKLNDNQIPSLQNRIAATCKGRYAVIEISPERYNDLYEQLRKENRKLNTLLAWGHAKAIEETLSKVECDVAIADQFADERFIQEKLQEKGKQLRLIQMHKAEQNVAVAAASIMARARFLQKLSILSNKYGIELPKGASAKVIENGKKFVRVNGKEVLRKVAKLHFKTTTEILSGI